MLAMPQLVAAPHHLLVTLVLINASATEALPLCLDRLYSPAGALARTITFARLRYGESMPSHEVKCCWS